MRALHLALAACVLIPADLTLASPAFSLTARGKFNEAGYFLWSRDGFFDLEVDATGSGAISGMYLYLEVAAESWGGFSHPPVADFVVDHGTIWEHHQPQYTMEEYIDFAHGGAIHEIIILHVVVPEPVNAPGRVATLTFRTPIETSWFFSTAPTETGLVSDWNGEPAGGQASTGAYLDAPEPATLLLVLLGAPLGFGQATAPSAFRRDKTRSN